MAARLRRVSTKNNSPDAVLFRGYFVAAACHTQSMAARLRRVSTKNNSPDAVLFRGYFVAAACHTQSMAARLRRVSTKNNSPDAVLFRRYFVAAACHTQSMAARLRRVSAKNNSPDAVLFRGYFVAAACGFVGRGPRAPPLHVRQAAGHMGPALQDYLQGDTASRVPLYLLRHAQLGAAGAGIVRQLLLAGAVACTSGGGTHGSRPTGLFAGGYGVPRALIPSPPRAAWRYGRGGCAPTPPRRRRWACGSPAAAWASCRTRTPGIPAGRCSRWPAPAWFS